MHRIQLHYTLSRDSRSAAVRNPLIELLQAVAQQGSISAAARALDFSYRHVWGELKRWEEHLGQALVTWDKGQPARLTEFAAKLVWAERQAQVRLAPQIDALRADLERVFAVAFDPKAHVVTLHASHDDALTALREFALPLQLHLDVRFCGSVDALRGLNEGRCVLAGFHTVHGARQGSLAERVYKPLLQPGRHKIIGFANRTQGLLVAQGNPLGIKSLQDVKRLKARYINRPLGTGTRVVLDELLEQDGLQPQHLAGYAHCEPSHGAVALAVANGAADVGLGIEIAARTHGLDFVPLVQEHYHLVCLKSALNEPTVVALCNLLKTPAWQTQLAALPGYTPAHSGEVVSMRQLLPWWDFARLKK